MRVPSLSPAAALDKCIALYGPRSEASAANINSGNRREAKLWLTAMGVPSAAVSGMALETLREIYADISDVCLGMFIPAPATSAQPAPDDAAANLVAAIQALTVQGAKSAPLDEARVVELIRQHSVKTVRHEIALPNGRVVTLPDEAFHPVFPEVLAAIAAGLNVMIVGPAGSGKTHLAEQVAKALGLDYSFTGAIMQEHKVLGFRNPMGETVRTAFRDRYEHGGLFLADEIDASSANALLALNAGLANGSQDFPDGNVKRHPDFRGIASANTFGTGANAQYVGRNQLDAASLDRFYVIPMGYDEATERAIYLGETPKPVALFKPRALSDQEKVDWVNYVHKARAGVERANMRHVVSGRAIASGLKALAMGIPLANVRRGALWKNQGPADIAKAMGAAGMSQAA